MDLRHQHVPRWLYWTLTSAWSWAAAQLKEINMALGGVTGLIKSTDSHMALSSSTDQGHQHSPNNCMGHSLQHGPWPATWLLAVAPISVIQMGLDSNVGSRYEHDPSYIRNIDHWSWSMALSDLPLPQTSPVQMMVNCDSYPCMFFFLNPWEWGHRLYFLCISNFK